MGGYIGSKGVGIISGIDASIADLNLTDKAAANGVTEANKVLTADANKDVTAIRNLAATGDVTAGGAITATGASVGALARGAIQTGNASGVAAPLTKGAEGTVLTAGANDLSWVAASGGGEQTFTATGAISAGDIVGFNPNGTISVGEAQLQASVAQGSGAANNQALVYDTANDKVLLFFRGTSGYLYGRVGTIANGQISFGTVASTSYVAGHVHAAYDVNSGKAVVTYQQSGGNNYPYAIVATVSGTNLSFGSPVVMKSSPQYYPTVRYDSNAQKVLCIYNGSSYSRVLGRVGTVSGTSISFGTEAEVTTVSMITGTTALSFDSTANKFILAFIELNKNVPKIRTLTISGTNVSGGTEVELDGLANNSYAQELTYIPSANKTVLTSSYTGSYWHYYILTISGTNVSTTSGVRYDTTLLAAAGNSYVVVAGSKQYLQYYETAGNFNTLLEASVGATEITFAPLSEKIQWGAGSSSTYPVAVYDPDTTSLVNADGTNVRVFNPEAPSFVGIAAENISDGATGTITVAGGINTSVSGLTAGKLYGTIASSAALTEVGVGGVGAVGVALSSSSIYLNVGKL